MNFKSEADLVFVLKQSLANLFSTERFSILEEVSVGNGIADLVIAAFHSEYKLTGKRISILDFKDINLFLLIKKANEICIENIQEITREKILTLKKRISKLIDDGYVIDNNGIYSVTNKNMLINNFHIAVEAKLRNWNQALKQAYRYRWFAEYTYVVIDEHNISAAIKNINEFRKYNVGLASINVGGKVIRYYKPEKSIPLDERMKILLSEKVKYQLAFSK